MEMKIRPRPLLAKGGIAFLLPLEKGGSEGFEKDDIHRSQKCVNVF